MSAATLVEPYHRFVAETNWLLAEFSHALARLTTPQTADYASRMSAEMVVLRLHDGWARYCREVVLSSAADRPYTASGIRLPRAPGVTCRSDVIPRLLNSYRVTRKHEPKWHSAQECVTAAQLLGIPNFSTFSSAIGAVNSPADDLRIARNFFAHRGPDTALKVRGHTPYSLLRRIEVVSLCGAKVPPGLMRLESWIIDLRNIAEAAIQ